MNKTLIAVLVLFVALLGVLGLVGVTWMNTSNQAVQLEMQFKAQIEANKSTYDKMWKVLSQKAQITDKYSEDFRKSYEAIMQGRYGNNKNFQGSLMQWIQERNPTLSPEMYKDLSQAVESYRGEFDEAQKRMIDIKREHDVLRLSFPSRLFVGGRPELELKLVLSSRTEATFESGMDDSVNVFPAK